MSGLTKKIIAIAGASAFVSGAAMAADLTVVSWGGAYTKSQVEAYHKPWMAKTGKVHRIGRLRRGYCRDQSAG